jgi:predicted nucleic acid-binding protein
VRRSRAVFDASVLGRALVDEAPDAEAWVQSLSTGATRVVAPELIYAEVASIFLKQVNAGRLDLDDAVQLLGSFVRSPLDARRNRGISEAALGIAAYSGLTAYDAHYLALAEAEDAVLVTADRDLAAAATRSVLLE